MGRPKKAESKEVGKGKAATLKKILNKAKIKDPNKPKRPASAFFVFMEEFRKEFNEKIDPLNKSVAAVSKAGGDKWKSMSEARKAPYVAQAEERKEKYIKDMGEYNKMKPEKKSSDKSKCDTADAEEMEEEDEEDHHIDDYRLVRRHGESKSDFCFCIELI